MRRFHSNTVTGLLCVLFAIVLFFVWIPLDTATGFVESSRGKLIVGDGLAPALAAFSFLVTGLLLVFGEKPDSAPAPSLRNLKFLLRLAGVVAAALLLMRFAGPVITGLIAEEPYRVLRNTVPYKYLGFALGGFTMVFGIIAVVEARLSWRAAMVGVIGVAVIILLYDIPFEDLLLPPNGDV